MAALDNFAHQRVTVGVRAIRGHAQYHVAGLMCSPVIILAFSTTPTAKPARSYRPPDTCPASRSLAAYQRAARLFAAVGDAFDHFGSGIHIQLAQQSSPRKNSGSALAPECRSRSCRPGRYPRCHGDSVQTPVSVWCRRHPCRIPAQALYIFLEISTRPPKPPMPLSTSGRMVRLAKGLIFSTGDRRHRYPHRRRGRRGNL